jgi:ferredoxin-NADP reductase
MNSKPKKDVSENPKPDSAPPGRHRIKKLDVMVSEVIRETHDSATLVLFTGNDHLTYKPGHFLTIDPHQFPALERFIEYFEEIKGKKEPARAYSLTSAPHDKHLAITIKEEYYTSGITHYPPLLSPLLVWRTQPGTRMEVTGFGGPYVLPDDIETQTDHLIHICAGSGIVPNFSMLRHALTQQMNLRHTLIYGNRTYRDIIFRQALDELSREFSDRLTIVHALSRENDVSKYGPDFYRGRVDRSLIASMIEDPTAVRVFSCGPAVGRWEKMAAKESGLEPKPRFMESVSEALEEIGVPSENIRREKYG